jgi:hypothetical protein
MKTQKKSYCQVSFECTLDSDEQTKCKYYICNYALLSNDKRCLYNMVGTCQQVDAIKQALVNNEKGIRSIN